MTPVSGSSTRGALAGLEKIEGVGMPWQWQHPFLLGRRDVYMSGEREMRSGPLDGVKVVDSDDCPGDAAFTTSGSTSAAATAVAVSLAVSFSCTDAEDARTAAAASSLAAPPHGALRVLPDPARLAMDPAAPRAPRPRLHL
ncbi:hypothetical protein ZWY2020_035244 [Hordeum vulgare]|nr:hypothetical protein ZWY2020_035244 [Hordeum vulgare]